MKILKNVFAEHDSAAWIQFMPRGSNGKVHNKSVPQAQIRGGNMCYCPFADKHCDSGKVEDRLEECEFWDGTDCRVRKILELSELLIKKLMKEV